MAPEEDEESCSPYRDEVIDFLDNDIENDNDNDNGNYNYNGINNDNNNSNFNYTNDGDDNFVSNDDYLYGLDEDQGDIAKQEGTHVSPSLITKISQSEDKAGLEQCDKNKVNQVIYQSTKGSRFFNKSQKDDERAKVRVGRMMQEYAQIRKEEIPDLERSAERLIAKLETERDLTRSWLHVDMDAFYASVEIRDDPKLEGIPMAVGGMSMLCTSNYEARKYGVRSAMPGFIALKLCPNLTIVPMNMKKYKEASNFTRDIFARYDPNFEAFSLDEASLDITSYLASHHGVSSDDVANQIRSSMREETKLTCSIGIACNRRLAKICSNINKPDGQFLLPSVRDDIVAFMENLSIRKAPGIGKVTEKLLNALEITKCGELYEKRGMIFRLFPGISSDYFFRIALGLGPVIHTEARASKSVSTERTFAHTADPLFLFPLCVQLSHSLSSLLKKKQLEGRTLTLKIKTANFETKTRSITLSKYWSDEDEIYQHAKKLLEDEMPVDIRLMGVRMSGFKDQQQKQGVRTFYSQGKAGLPIDKGIIGDESVSPYAVPSRDLLRDEDVEYAQRLWKDGVSAELVVYPGVYHAFSIVNTLHTQASKDYAYRSLLALKRALFPSSL